MRQNDEPPSVEAGRHLSVRPKSHFARVPSPPPTNIIDGKYVIGYRYLAAGRCCRINQWTVKIEVARLFHYQVTCFTSSRPDQTTVGLLSGPSNYVLAFMIATLDPRRRVLCSRVYVMHHRFNTIVPRNDEMKLNASNWGCERKGFLKYCSIILLNCVPFSFVPITVMIFIARLTGWSFSNGFERDLTNLVIV